MYRKLLRLWNNPTAKRIIIWAWPFVLAWLTKKMGQKSTKTTSAGKKTKKS